MVDVAGRSDWQSPLYVALAPLAFLRPGSRRLALGLWGFVAYLFLTWWLLDPPARPVLAAALAAAGGPRGPGGRLGPAPAWSILLGMIMTIALLTNLTLHLDAPWRA